MITINGERYIRETFPDGTRKMQGELFYHKYARHVQINWFYDNENELIDIIYIASHLRESNTCGYSLFMPYIPNARNDRVHSGEEVFTLKYFASVINSLGFYKVEVLDPHSHVSEALFDRIEVLDPCRYINHAAGVVVNITRQNPDNVVFCYPDEGAMKRYSELVQNPYVFGIKKRDWKTGNILGLEIMGDPALIEGKNILIVDDICSKGGTFYHTSKKLKEMGAAKVFLYVTHCENTIFDGELLKDNGLIERVFTTDSIFRGEHEKIEVFQL